MFSGQNIAARYTFSANRHIFARSISQQFRRFTRVAAQVGPFGSACRGFRLHGNHHGFMSLDCCPITASTVFTLRLSCPAVFAMAKGPVTNQIYDPMWADVDPRSY